MYSNLRRACVRGSAELQARTGGVCGNYPHPSQHGGSARAEPAIGTSSFTAVVRSVSLNLEWLRMSMPVVIVSESDSLDSG